MPFSGFLSKGKSAILAILNSWSTQVATSPESHNSAWVTSQGKGLAESPFIDISPSTSMEISPSGNCRSLHGAAAIFGLWGLHLQQLLQ